MLFLSIIIFLFFFYFTYHKPVIALAILAGLLPTYLIRFNLFGVPVTFLEIIILSIFTGWFIFFRHSDLIKKRLSKIRIPLILFFLASVIAVIIAPDKISALGIWKAYFFEAGLIFFLIIALVHNRKDFSHIVFGLSISALLISLYAIAQKFLGFPIPYKWASELRATSIFPYPNAVGLYLAPIILLMINEGIADIKKIKLSAYFILTSILALIAIAVAQSDGALIGLAVGLFIFIILHVLVKGRYKTGIAIIILVLVIASLTFSLVAPVKDKIMLKDWSGMVRFTIWGETWNMLRDNFIFGAGLDGYKIKIWPYHESYQWMEVFLYPHNIIFNFWSELGLLGVASFIWLISSFYKTCYLLIKKERVFIITAISAMIVLLVHGLVDVPYFKNDLSILFWIIFSMPFIGIKEERD